MAAAAARVARVRAVEEVWWVQAASEAVAWVG